MKVTAMKTRTTMKARMAKTARTVKTDTDSEPPRRRQNKSAIQNLDLPRPSSLPTIDAMGAMLHCNVR